MIFVIYRIDAAATSGVRDGFRNSHLDYLARFTMQILCAGALLCDSDTSLPVAQRREIGSMYLVDFPTESAAWRFAQEDPFHLAGLFASVEVREFIPRLGALAADLTSRAAYLGVASENSA